MSANKLTQKDIEYLLALIMSDDKCSPTEKLRIMNILAAKAEKKKAKYEKKEKPVEKKEEKPAEKKEENPVAKKSNAVLTPINDKPISIPPKFVEKHLGKMDVEAALKKITNAKFNGDMLRVNGKELETEKGFFNWQKKVADAAFVTEKGGKSSNEEFKLVGEYLRQFARTLNVEPYVFTGKPQPKTNASAAPANGNWSEMTDSASIESIPSEQNAS